MKFFVLKNIPFRSPATQCRPSEVTFHPQFLLLDRSSTRGAAFGGVARFPFQVHQQAGYFG